MIRYIVAFVMLPPMAMAETIAGYASVHDGDTLRIGRVSIRLHGVDAPELNEPGGTTARDTLIKIIEDRIVMCHPTGAQSYNRIVARCSTDRVNDLGAALIWGGYALDCRRYSKGEYASLEPVGVRSRITPKGYCK